MTTAAPKETVESVASEMSAKTVRTADDWEGVWTTGGADGGKLMPGHKFDAGKSSPMLHAVISRDVEAHDGAHGVEGRRVLVPGCGRGYDVLTFARAGASEAVGLEIAPTGNAEAQKILRDATAADHKLRGVCSVVDKDFFSLPSSSGPSPSLFDIVYDYTFLCALEPARRTAWATTMASIVKPGGQLWTIIFPISDHDGGPPFAVSPAVYRSLLLESFEEVSLAPVPDELSHNGRESKEAFAVWERRK